MTEEVSPIYEQVSIEDWADRIHQNKIQELQVLLDKKKAEFEPYTRQAKVNSFSDVNEALEGLVVGIDMLKLTFKLKSLQKHGRK
jgi:hypothetical protein